MSDPKTVLKKIKENGCKYVDLRFTDQLHARDAQLSAQIEQVVLHAGQALAHCRRQTGHGKHHTNGAVRLVDRAVGLDSGCIFGHSRAIAESRGAIVAGARVDLAEPISHAR